MKKRDVEKYINIAVSNSVPDVLDDIILKCEEKRGFSKNMKTKEVNIEKKSFFLTPKFIGGACAAVLLLGIVGFTGVNQYNRYFSVDSIIELDVNPSIELKVNKDEKVIDAIALNDEAKKVLDGMDLEKVDLDVAVNAIIGSMTKNGYLTVDKNSILVSVKNKDSKESERLQKEITDKINGMLKEDSINGSVLTQNYESDSEIEKLAKEYGISEGKAKLIKRVLDTKLVNANGEVYTFKSLAGLSINELNLLLTEKNTKLENVNTNGAVSTSGYIGKDKAKTIALADASLSEDKVKHLQIDLDADDGMLIYEVEFDYEHKEYDYDINAKTGEIVFREIDNNDDYVPEKEPEQKPSVDTKPNTDNSGRISKEKAKEIALGNAGAREGQVKGLEVELDYDDGIYHYEVEFKYNGKEYSYDINAKTGKIIDRDVERDDD